MQSFLSAAVPQTGIPVDLLEDEREKLAPILGVSADDLRRTPRVNSGDSRGGNTTSTEKRTRNDADRGVISDEDVVWRWLKLTDAQRQAAARKMLDDGRLALSNKLELVPVGSEFLPR